MSSQHAVFVCKECKEVVHYDFNQKLNEDEWKMLQDLPLSSNAVVRDPEKILEQSFVFINKNWEKLQHYNTNNNNNNNNKKHNLDDAKERKSDGLSSEPEPNHNNKLNANDFAQCLNVLECILQITAGHAGVQHPLCSDCSDKIMKGLDSEIEELNLEKKTLNAFISQWQNENEEQNEHEKQHKNEEEARLKQYSSEAQALERKLANICVEKQRLKLEFEQLEMEAQRMNEFEEMFFCDANDFWYSIENLSMQHAAVRQKMRRISTHLDLMKSTNVFDDAFHIYHDGHFGTINGLRLGRLPSVCVEWEEINTGLGQCVLLLDVLAQRCKSKNFKFKIYELYPMGSFSYICEKKTQKIHHMYGSTGLFGYKQCDKALECFLQCIKQFAVWMISQDNKFYLRYQINGHQIGDIKNKKFLSIRFAQSTEENWTQALKYMVIDLKYLLAWVARYSP